jgi:ketosteroid isomerase-like protein
LANEREVAVEKVEHMRTSTADHDALSALNEDYIRSVQTGDVARFDELLAADFRASLGTTYLDRAEFLAQTALPVTISNLAARDVEIRVMGDVGIVHARTTYRTADGVDRSGRYTDVWVREGDGWRAVAAHVTR